jgi:hypothetical protein
MAVDVRYRNFFIPRVEKNLKISPWDEKACLPRAYGPWEESFSSRGLIFGGFFNPWDEEISIPDIRLIRKSLISCHQEMGWIFISKVDPFGLAEQNGLKVGERIFGINGICLMEATMSDAIDALRNCNAKDFKVLVQQTRAGTFVGRKELEPKPDSSCLIL